MAPNTGLIQTIAIDPAGDPLGPGIIGIGEDADGELLLVVTATNFNPTGRLVRLVGMTSDPPGPPPGVPDGTTSGQAMTVAKLDAAAADLSIGWDTVSCPGTRGHQIVYGWGSDLPIAPGGSFGSAGSRCNVGITSPFTWRTTPDPLADPSALLWWLMIAHDGAVTEGSWGSDGSDVERQGPAAGGSSGECGITTKDVGNTCGQ
jgi:hypothetical protein